MGGKTSKARSASSHALMTHDEYERLKTFFDSVCSDPRVGCSYSDMEKHCSSQLDSRLTEYILRFYFGEDRAKHIDLKGFSRWFRYMVRGSIDDKAQVLMTIFETNESDAPIPVGKILEYLKSVIVSYIMLQSVHRCREYLSWRAIRCPLTDSSIDHLAESLCYEMTFQKEYVSIKELEWWIMSWVTLNIMHTYVFSCLFHVEYSVETDESGENKDMTLFPLCKMSTRQSYFPSVLDICSVIHINSALPRENRGEWRLIFSSSVHGLSFNKMMERILQQGSNVLIVKDKDGFIFGGFAPESWVIDNNFRGNRSSFLFTLHPYMRIYISSGDNDHYQYMNYKARALPSGLGMGGQIGYFGIWLDGEYVDGGHSSETCSTYLDYRMLSSNEHFDIQRLEVWGVGPPPEKLPAKRTSSILTTTSILESSGSNLQARSLLQRTGRQRYSDGFRASRIAEEQDGFLDSHEEYKSESEDDGF